MKIHPNDKALEEFLLSLGEQHRRLVRHLTWCNYCRSRLVYLPRPLPLSPETGKGAGSGYDQTVSASRRAVAKWGADLERERDDAPGLFVELLEQPAERIGSMPLKTEREAQPRA